MKIFSLLWCFHVYSVDSYGWTQKQEANKEILTCKARNVLEAMQYFGMAERFMKTETEGCWIVAENFA